MNLISAFVFTTWIVQFLFFLNLILPASSHLLCLYSSVCVGPNWRPHCLFSHDAANMWSNVQLIGEDKTYVNFMFCFFFSLISKTICLKKQKKKQMELAHQKTIVLSFKPRQSSKLQDRREKINFGSKCFPKG